MTAERRSAGFSHKFEKGGTYYVRITDYEGSGRGSNFYRIIVGQLPVVRTTYPLGLRRGEEREISVTGYNLGAAKIAVKGVPSSDDENAVILRPKAPAGLTFNDVRLALGDDPEVEAQVRIPGSRPRRR